jgi:hypothetical protein
MALVKGMYSPSGAAEWLQERLGRSISQRTIALYITAGDLPAQDIQGGKKPRYVIREEDLEIFAQKVGPDGKLPTPSSGWPAWPEGYQRKSRRKTDGKKKPSS